MVARGKTCWWFILVTLLACGPVNARTPNDTKAEAQVREVIRQFDAAIVAQDGAALRRLFLPSPNAWVAVLGDADYARLKARRPEAGRIYPDTYERFAAMVETAKLQQRERFTDVDIRTDGAMAIVSFDYVYEEGGVPQNRGIESWQMVKSGDDWKIVSMLYSVHRP